MDRAHRLNEAFLYLRSCGKIHTQKDLANAMSTTPPNVSSALKGVDKVLTENFIRRFVDAFDGIISYDWLLSGEGEMLKKVHSFESNAKLIGQVRSVSNDETVAVRYFEISPTASFKEFCEGQTETPDVINIIPEPRETLDETYCVFDVAGDSMAPQIQNKSRILCREIPPTQWHNLRDCIVAIAYDDRFVLKRIISNNLESENYLKLASDNPEYTATETVSLSAIRCIFRAIRIVSQHIC